ncbi:MAG: YecA family protein [Piscinibacter sp.]|nr:YecA family protein [Piscinibacter sp.]
MRRNHLPARPIRAAQQALTEAELGELQERLDRVPASLEPLDVDMLDGYLCGVVLQPRPVPRERWLPHVVDVDAREVPAGFDTARLHSLVLRRHAELERAITARHWFDPWVFELEDDGDPSAAVYGWVAGFATAMSLFPALQQLDAQRITEPLALIYRHLDPDDLEDADDLLEEIESIEPAATLAEAVEDLVRATLLLADAARPAPVPRRR